MIDWKKFQKMTPAQLKQKLSAFVIYMKEDMPKLKKIGICVVAAIILFILGGQVNSMLKTSVKSTIERRDDYKNIQVFLETYTRDAKGYKDEMAKIKGKLLDEATIEKSSTLIQKIAGNNGVTIVSSSRVNKVRKIGSGVETQAMKISLQGKYTNIMKMISEMEDASFFVNIENLIIKDSASGPNDEINADIEYVVFYESASKEEGKA